MQAYSKQYGFTLVEVIIVVAIISILAALAVPAYSGYIKRAKMNALIEHVTNGFKLIKAEEAKITAGSIGKDVILQLNLGNRVAIGATVATPAYVANTATTALPGQVAIDGLGKIGAVNNLPTPGSTVTITGIPVTGTVAAEYISGLSINFTPE